VSVGSPLSVAAEADELPELPFAIAPVEEFVRALSKAVRTHQLYLPNNPVYQRAIDNVRAAFVPIWKETTELSLQISESEFRWYGRSVMHETSRSESLPWVFYKDGLREITIVQGFEKDELATLLDLLQRVRKAAPEEDDLLTLMWEQEFVYLRYRFIDIGLDALEAPDPSAGPMDTTRTIPPVREEVEEKPDAPRPKNMVRLEDFDSTLYFLDEHEVEYLRAQVTSDVTMDLRRNVVDLLLDIYENETTPTTREEIAGILESLVLHLLSAGEFGVVAYLLREADVTAHGAAQIDPTQRERLGGLARGLSDPQVLSKLLTALDEAVNLPPQEELDALFSQLRQGTLGVVLGYLRQVQSPAVRSALEKAATRLASMNTNELMQLIGSDDEMIALEAIRRVGELKITAAVAQLGKVLSSQNASLRLATAQAVGEIGSPGALRLLEKAVDDDERDVRVVAVRALGARGHRAALPRVEAWVKGKGVRQADLTEKMAYFEAYSLLAGQLGIQHLDRLLNSRGFFVRKADPETRACAAMGLGRIGSSDATDALRRASKEKDIMVRSAINKALRGGAP
jgi:HEAT repeat protein